MFTSKTVSGSYAHKNNVHYTDTMKIVWMQTEHWICKGNIEPRQQSLLGLTLPFGHWAVAI
jgi:hypothetical protein